MSQDPILDAAPHEFIHPRGAKEAVLHLPQNILIAFLKIYRAVISPLYGDVCRYYPSCSAYSLEATTLHGATRGISLTVARLLRCHPWATGGLDPVPPGKRHFLPGEEPKIMLLNHPELAQNYAQESTPHRAENAHKEN